MEIADIIRRYIRDSNNADLLGSACGLADDPGRLIREMRRIINLGRMRHARVLDVGCGFGWNALVIALLGDNQVVCNDVRPMMTSVIEQRLIALNVNANITTLTGDICALDIPAESFDAVVCNQTLEHVHDLDAMFRTIRRALKPGGRAVFTNDNNALHPAMRRQNEQMWRQRDTSWAYIDELKQQRPDENRDIEPYAVMRRHIIARARPDLGNDAIDALTEATAGMIEPEIIAAAQRHGPSIALPTPPALSWCRNPVTGEYCERLLDPFAIIEMARHAGFNAQLNHHTFRRFPLTTLNWINNNWANRLIFRWKPAFTIVAENPPRP